jgi:hypothetical protein
MLNDRVGHPHQGAGLPQAGLQLRRMEIIPHSGPLGLARGDNLLARDKVTSDLLYYTYTYSNTQPDTTLVRIKLI